MAALRFEVQGMVDGRAAIVVEHVTRLRDDLAPDWPAPTGKGCYRVQITGSPSITCDLQLEGDGGDENSGGLITTAMRLLNAIPAVCAAAPGLVSALDLPMVPGRHLLARGAGDPA
jgi:4-hydroxy-tetrahydrodipicolinate reductase